jgi:hypothetical protein
MQTEQKEQKEPNPTGLAVGTKVKLYLSLKACTVTCMAEIIRQNPENPARWTIKILNLDYITSIITRDLQMYIHLAEYEFWDEYEGRGDYVLACSYTHKWL